MPRGENFRGKPGPGRRKGVPNRVTPEVREASRRLVEDPAYFANLRDRLVRGKAEAMEVVLWRYAYGEPREAPTEELQERRFEAIREAARQRLRSLDPASLQVFTALSMGLSLAQALRAAGVEPSRT
jgi:hypothetical protein